MTVFDTQYAAHYDRLYAGKDYKSECDLIEVAIDKYAPSPPKSLLDVGCGTGQHAIELARRGFQVTGVDLSTSMLLHAAENAASLVPARRPIWRQGDARSFDADGRFDIAIMMFAVVGYLTGNDDVLAGLRNIRRHLAPGALFLCDFWYGPSVLHDRPGDRVRILPTSRGEIVRTTQTILDIVRHTADVTFRLLSLEDGRVASDTRETHRTRFFFPQEFSLFLSQTGFEMLGISAFPTIDAPLTDATWNAFAVARAV